MWLLPKKIQCQPGALRPNRTSDADFFCLGNISAPIMQCFKFVLEGTSPYGERRRRFVVMIIII